ncbi:hypothetical protein [Gracilimonas sp.]|uniref:hypothetical protein n=1 Tax=Gracilimonas sp. TaxID=1974203 RepID=UPI0028710355|nr:hypothetical protein [Gracilimonas sp.]
MKLLLSILFVGSVLLITGCSDQSMNTSPPEQLLTAEGQSVVPGAENLPVWSAPGADSKQKQDGRFSVHKKQYEQLMAVINEFSDSQERPYVALLSDRKGNGNTFTYRYATINPGEESVQKANGEYLLYVRWFVDPGPRKVYRMLAVKVPNTERDLQLVKQWGQQLNSPVVKGKSTSTECSQQIEEEMECIGEDCFIAAEFDVCAPAYEIDETDDEDEFWDGGGQCPVEYGCDGAPITDGGGSGGGSTTECALDGYVKNDDGVCVLEDPCEGEDPPAYCENPCNTGDAILDSLETQQTMEDVWEESYGTNDNPLDDNDRNEAVYYIMELDNSYVFEPVSLQSVDNPVSSCHFRGSYSTSKIQNSVGLLHTHPYKHNEEINDQRCLDYNDWDIEEKDGYPKYNALDVSSGDQNVVQGISLKNMFWIKLIYGLFNHKIPTSIVKQLVDVDISYFEIKLIISNNKKMKSYINTTIIISSVLFAFLAFQTNGHTYTVTTKGSCPAFEVETKKTLTRFFESDSESFHENRLEMGIDGLSVDEFTPLVTKQDSTVCQKLNKKTSSSHDFLTTYYKSADLLVVVKALKPPVKSKNREHVYISTGYSTISFYDRDFQLISTVRL